MFYWWFLVVLGGFGVWFFFLDSTPMQLEGRAWSPPARLELSEAGHEMGCAVPAALGSLGRALGQEGGAPSAPAKKNLSRTSSPLC